jgi:hypothetical protein
MHDLARAHARMPMQLKRRTQARARGCARMRGR